MYTIVWAEPALQHIQSAHDYIAQFNPIAAIKVAKTLKKSGHSLAYNPCIGRRVPKTNMRELVTSYPYIIRYRIVRDTVVILRVRHTSRRPTNP